MGINKNLSKDQLKLFMTGTEWKASINDSMDRDWITDGPGDYRQENMGELWSRKEDEAREPKKQDHHGSGLYDAIKKDGYDPNKADIENGDVGPKIVRYRGELTQVEGHHRIAAAAAVEKDTGKLSWIPTNYQSWS